MPKNLPILTSSVREVTVDVDAADLRGPADGYDVLILRVTGLLSDGTGRPVHRSVRIPTSMLAPAEWS